MFRDSANVDHTDEEVSALAYDNLFFPFASLISGIVLSVIFLGCEQVRRDYFKAIK